LGNCWNMKIENPGSKKEEGEKKKAENGKRNPGSW
jgi:hypothetical protein